MSDTKHSPGKWKKTQSDRPGGGFGIRSDNLGIAYVFSSKDVCPNDPDEAEANVDLMVAAPALLEACEAHDIWRQAEEDKSRRYSFHDKMNLCAYAEFLTNKALAKVRGEQFDETWEGVPQILIDIRTMKPRLEREQGKPSAFAKAKE